MWMNCCSITATNWPRRCASWSLSKRQAGIRAGVRANDGGGYYDGYNYGDNAYDSAANRSQAKKEEMAVANDTRVQGWQLIDNATADIRRTLTKKYGVEF